jgi:hypothetical protein
LIISDVASQAQTKMMMKWSPKGRLFDSAPYGFEREEPAAKPST